MKEMPINIFELISSKAAVSSEDGEMLYRQIIKGLKKEDIVILLNFANIDLITSTFLNAAIGQLYNDYDSPFLREKLKIKNMPPEDVQLLKKVIERAKEYFKDKNKVDASIRDATEDD